MATIAHNEDRVKKATPSSTNEKIEAHTWDSVAGYSNKSEPEISARIKALNNEWDIERYLGVNMSTLAMIGLALAYFVHINWLILPAIVLIFFFQHSVQGWCPPLPILRSFKIRTRKEIEQEKYALKFIRGDFDNLDSLSARKTEDLKQAIKKS
jgi:hypothetical protein